MSILYYRMSDDIETLCQKQEDERFSRNVVGDIKHGLDLILDFKAKIDKLHPVAREVIIRMLAD